MTELVSANTDDLDAFVEHGESLQQPLRDTVETLRLQRNYLLSIGLPQVVETSEIPTLDNTLIFMTDLDRFVDVISRSLKNYGEELGHGVFAASAARIESRLEVKEDTRFDALEGALRREGLSEDDARLIRDQAELVLEFNPRFELNGATLSEPVELAAAIVQNIEDRADELIGNNQNTSSGLHARPSLSVDQLASDLHYGNNSDPFAPEGLLMAQLSARLTDEQNNKLDEQLEKLDQREKMANFSLVEDAVDAPEFDADFDALAVDVQALYQDNSVGPGIYGGEHRLNEPEIAYQLQKIAEEDPGRAIGFKWMLEGLMTPDERAELDRALAGDASWSDRVDRAIAHPRDGVEGAAKGSWNNTVGWLADEIADYQVGVTHGVYGLAAGSNPALSPEVRRALPQAPGSWQELDAIVQLEMEMDNIAEQGGDDIALAVDIGMAAYSGGRGGLTLVRVGRRYLVRNGRTFVAAVRGTPPPNTRGQMPRYGNRVVVTQKGPTCGPNSCAMGLDTLGAQIDDLDAFVARFNVGPNGTTVPQMVRDLRKMGVESTFRYELGVQDIAAHTRNGRPMLVHVLHPNPQGTGHFVVVDGVTTRYGRRVVAIRDPHGRQYFEDLEIFEERFVFRQGLTFEG